MSAASPWSPSVWRSPACYYQTDLSSQGATFEESDYFDGHDAEHPLPHYPDVPTPDAVIAASTGGEGCVPDEVTPAAPDGRKACSSAGIAIRVTPDEHLAWSYSLDGGAPVAITRARTIVPVAGGRRLRGRRHRDRWSVARRSRTTPRASGPSRGCATAPSTSDRRVVAAGADRDD